MFEENMEKSAAERFKTLPLFLKNEECSACSYLSTTTTPLVMRARVRSCISRLNGSKQSQMEKPFTYRQYLQATL